MIRQEHLDYLVEKYAAFRDGNLARHKCIETSLGVEKYLKPNYRDAIMISGDMAMAPLELNPWENDWHPHYWVSVAGVYLDFTATQFGHPFPFIINPKEAISAGYYSRRSQVKCTKCNDTGFVPAKPLAPAMGGVWRQNCTCPVGLSYLKSATLNCTKCNDTGLVPIPSPPRPARRGRWSEPCTCPAADWLIKE